MRVKCCNCGCRFDVPIRAVLEDADRIRQRQKPPAVESDGNKLAPDDVEARRVRDAAIKRRSSKNI